MTVTKIGAIQEESTTSLAHIGNCDDKLPKLQDELSDSGLGMYMGGYIGMMEKKMEASV